MGLAANALSLVIDPLTGDLIDTPDGWFQEGTDSRTEVLWQLRALYNAWWGDSSSGSKLKAAISGPDPGDAQSITDEALRALQPLVTEGVISDLAVTNDVDEGGHLVILLNYRDRSSGSLVDLAYVPFPG